MPISPSQKPKMAEFIAVLFLARDLAHRAHLRTSGPGSYAQHVALGDFYESVISLADTLAETYQGCYLTLLDIPLLDNEFPGDPEESMKKQLEWIKSHRGKAADDDETHIQNIIDEVVALYERTIFKLHFLK